MNRKITFLAMGEKAYHILDNMAEDHVSLIRAVIVGRDSHVVDDYADKIIAICKKNDIFCCERDFADAQLEHQDDYLLAVGWRWIIAADQSRLIVVHDSLLPRYRGFAPLVNCLINGEVLIGATALFGAKEYDRGSVITQKSVRITYPIKIAAAISEMSKIYAAIVNELIDRISVGGVLTGVQQDESAATYSVWRDADDYFIDWDRAASEVSRFIDAVGHPYFGAKARLNGEVVVINDARAIPDVQVEDRRNAVGKVIFVNGINPVVVCGSGLLEIVDVRAEDGESLLPLRKFRSRFS